MTTPNDMPKRVNPTYQQILDALLDNKIRTLAGNVSDQNIERIARRWLG